MPIHITHNHVLFLYMCKKHSHHRIICQAAWFLVGLGNIYLVCHGWPELYHILEHIPCHSVHHPPTRCHQDVYITSQLHLLNTSLSAAVVAVLLLPMLLFPAASFETDYVPVYAAAVPLSIVTLVGQSYFVCCLTLRCSVELKAVNRWRLNTSSLM